MLRSWYVFVFKLRFAHLVPYGIAVCVNSQGILKIGHSLRWVANQFLGHAFIKKLVKLLFLAGSEGCSGRFIAFFFMDGRFMGATGA